MQSKKLNVGPLPEQTYDYDHLETTELRWDRIAGIAAIIVLLVLGATWILGSSEEDNPVPFAVDTNTVDVASEEYLVQDKPEVEETPIEPIPAPEDLPATPLETVVEKSPEADEQVDAVEPQQPTLMPATQDDIQQIQNQIAQVSEQADLALIPEDEPLRGLEPVTILSEHIIQAKLTDTVSKKAPDDALGYVIQMEDSGLIKVVLFTHMQDLQGKTLYHDWLLGDRRMARVKVPVSRQDQQSSSSKWIDKFMLGAWTVQVVDDNDLLYAIAEFEVR